MRIGSRLDKRTIANIALSNTSDFSVDERINIIAELLDMLGISVTTTVGTFKSLNEIMQQLYRRGTMCVGVHDSNAVETSIRFIRSIPFDYHNELLLRCYHASFHRYNDFGVDLECEDSFRLHDDMIANYNFVKWADSPDDTAYLGYEPDTDSDNTSSNTALDDFLAEFKIVKGGD